MVFCVPPSVTANGTGYIAIRNCRARTQVGRYRVRNDDPFRWVIGEVASRKGGPLLGSHGNLDVIDRHCRRKRFPGIDLFTQMFLHVRVPLDMTGTGDLTRALTYGNHISTVLHGSLVWFAS